MTDTPHSSKPERWSGISQGLKQFEKVLLYLRVFFLTFNASISRLYRSFGVVLPLSVTWIKMAGLYLFWQGGMPRKLCKKFLTSTLGSFIIVLDKFSWHPRISDHTSAQRRYPMRHLVFRLIISLIWLGVAILQAVRGDLPMAALSGILGICFLLSAYSIWKKDKDHRR